MQDGFVHRLQHRRVQKQGFYRYVRTFHLSFLCQCQQFVFFGVCVKLNTFCFQVFFQFRNSHAVQIFRLFFYCCRDFVACRFYQLTAFQQALNAVVVFVNLHDIKRCNHDTAVQHNNRRLHVFDINHLLISKRKPPYFRRLQD
nr:MAG TPA: hypothetical protein [Caudoviricetes sp.]DAX33128.1 MAG TPA: hypothetical protein [Caudoviricetes sp.]